jgi:hypothetical protein
VDTVKRPAPSRPWPAKCHAPKYAAISVVQRFDGAARLNLHWHVLCADGACVTSSAGLQVLPAPPLQQSVVEQVFADTLRRIDRQLHRLLGDPDEAPRDKLSQRDPAFAALLRNAMLGHQSVGKDAGKPQRVEFGKGPPEIKSHGQNCCIGNGSSLHANTTVGPQARSALEKLCHPHSRRDIESRLARFAHRGAPCVPAGDRGASAGAGGCSDLPEIAEERVEGWCVRGADLSLLPLPRPPLFRSGICARRTCR